MAIVPKVTVWEMVKVLSIFHHNRVVIIDGDNPDRKIRRGELLKLVKDVAGALTQLGVSHGDIVMISTAEPRWETIVVFLAANQIGAVCTIVDGDDDERVVRKYLKLFSEEHLVSRNDSRDKKSNPENVVQLGRVKVLFSAQMISELKLNRLEKYGVAAAVSYRDISINIDDDEDLLNYSRIGRGVLYYTFTDMVMMTAKLDRKDKVKVSKCRFNSELPALVTFTSGSTSGPKPMVFTNEALVAAAIYSKGQSGINLYDKVIQRYMGQVKFDSPYGFWTSVMTPILGGGCVITKPHWNYSKSIAMTKPDLLFATPALIEQLIREREELEEQELNRVIVNEKDYDLSSLKIIVSGGERLAAMTAAGLKQMFYQNDWDIPKICNGYGVGESLGCVTDAIGSEVRLGTVGRVCKGVKIKILDRDALNADEPEVHELGFNEIGVIAIGGKQILSGYVDRPELAKRFVEIDGETYVSTGDLGSLNERNYLILHGRGEFFINNEPAKVYYEVVRQAFARIPFVADSAVVKKPDSELRFRPAVFLVVDRTRGIVPVLNDEDLRSYVIALATEPYLSGKEMVCLKTREIPRPEDIYFLPGLPRNERTGKTDLRRLEEIAASC